MTTVRAAQRQWISEDACHGISNRSHFRPGAVAAELSQNQDLPRIMPKRKKKPWITLPKRGGFQVKKPPKERVLFPPDNGLLVPELVPVAHEVYEARVTLKSLITKLMEVIPVKACRYCSQTHVGPVGNEIASCDGAHSTIRKGRHVWTNANLDDVVADLDTYHLFDRLRTVKHDERFKVDRISAIVELCIQAGVDLPEYPAKRRTHPARVIGKMILEYDPLDELGFEISTNLTEEGISRTQEQWLPGEDDSFEGSSEEDCEVELGNHGNKEVSRMTELRQISTVLHMDKEAFSLSSQEIVSMAEMALKAWETMREGTKELMAKYPVKVCGYCPEVHIGPRGHKVKLCGAFKHQWRQGQHGWQEATLDDLIPPKYVWHVRDLNAPLLVNSLRRFYGQTPAVVELCVQAGAEVPDVYKPMMRLDIAIPDLDERENVL